MDLIGVTALSVEVSAGKVKLGTCSRPRALLFHVSKFYYCYLMPPSKISAHAIEWG